MASSSATEETGGDGTLADVAKLSNNLASTNLSVPSATTAIPVPQSLPTTLTRSIKVQEVDTHAFCQVFGDRIVVGVTQLHSHHIGNWITCQATMSPIDPKAVEWDLATVLGNHQDAMLEVYARRIVDCIIQPRLIPGTNRIAILLGISLQKTTKQVVSAEQDRERFRLIVDALVNLIGEALGVALYQSNK